MMENSINKYQHTQIGNLLLIVLVVVAVLFLTILSQTEFNLAIAGAMFFILFIVASFASLEVIIDEKYMRIKFGYGIFRKRFLLKDIISAKQVTNHWYYGWGIRFWFWPYMVIFNVSGFDAVEIKMNNGKIYRIGTDEPRELESVLNREI